MIFPSCLLYQIGAPASNTTKTAGFNFRLDGRMEARKAEFEKSQAQPKRKRDNIPPIPDFKALHAAQDAQLALRREHIKPVVPLLVEFSTDGRAKERQKFDEKIKEKEKELALATEQRRREREEEEAREVKELRKKAVPKAHEVPDWYKEAPRKLASGR